MYYADEDVPNVCGTCGVEGTPERKLFICTSCRQIKYCGRHCQKMDRQAHKRTCIALHSASKTQEETNEKIKHMIRSVFNDDDTHGFLYTYGIAETHPSKTEFISLDVARDDVQAVAACFNFLSVRLHDGHEIYGGQTVVSGQCAESDVKYAVIEVNKDIHRALLDKCAVACAHDANLLLIMPMAKLPFALPHAIVMHQCKIATSLLELGLWRSKLLAVDGEAVTTREQCRATCGTDVIVPGVLPYLTGVDVGETAEPMLVGGHELMVVHVQDKLKDQRAHAPEDPDVRIMAHQIVYHTFHPHPSGKSSKQRGRFIRFLNGDTDDTSPENLGECSFYDAFVHIDDWTTDWTFFLSDEEQQFVRDNIELMKRLLNFGERAGR